MKIDKRNWKIADLKGITGLKDVNDLGEDFESCSVIRREDVERFIKGEKVEVLIGVIYGDIPVGQETFDCVKVENIRKFLNISNHVLSPEQCNDINEKLGGVEIVELPKDLKDAWGNLNPDNYKEICDLIADYMDVEHIRFAHLAGFMPAVAYMVQKDIKTSFYYAFSVRESVEEVINGATIKKSIFKHKGWYRY